MKTENLIKNYVVISVYGVMMICYIIMTWKKLLRDIVILTHWGRVKMAAIS